jgi:hypothetical protein
MREQSGIGTIISKGRELLLFHYIRTYLKILRCCIETFGIGQQFFYFLIKIPIKLLYVHTSLLLDNIFFPKYRQVKIEKPIFLIGHPRSATTFFHEILTSTAEFLVFDNWEIHNPSLIIKKLVRGNNTLKIISNFISDFRHTPHRIKLEIKNHQAGIKGKIQEHKLRSGFIGQEEEMLFQNILDTQFIALATPIGFSENGFPELCFNDEQPHQEKSVLFLKNCFKRQIYHRGRKQIIAKMNFSLFRIKTLLKFFPDAKFIFLVRSPLETIPSHLSLQYFVLKRHYGLENIPPAKLERFLANRYKYNLLFYKEFINILSNNGVIPKDQFLEITYDSIKNDLLGVVQRVRRFTNLEFSPELENRLKEQHKKQSSYRRKHENLSLEAFNLTEDKIKSDFDFYFKRYGYGGKTQRRGNAERNAG